MREATSRRAFLASGAASFVALAGAPAILVRQAPYDLVIRGGTVFDGTGAAGTELDVGITGGRIAAVAARLPGRGTEEVDVRGLAVAPGFIDIHSHGDGSLAGDPRAESVVRQGITTIVVGQDGSSQATGRAGGGAGEKGAPASFAALFASLDELRPAVNVASMIGLGSVREAVVGLKDRPATDGELRAMTALVEQALAQGACGASSGLEYTPGAFASTAELVAVCRPLAARRLPYATHMRNEDDRLLESIDESIAVARGAGCPLRSRTSRRRGRATGGSSTRSLRASTPRAARASTWRSTATRTPRTRPA